ncbi:MAG: flagellar hook-length control protein FliK [Rhodocyclaceae bacterium]
MIPIDLASRLRTLIAATVRPTEAIAPIPDDLLQGSESESFDLRSGQRFSAQIQAAHADGTFRATSPAASRPFILSLAFPAKAGDMLELEAVETRTDGTIQARLADGEDALARPTISPAGKLIGQVLAGRWGEPRPVVLAQGQPIVNAPPAHGSENLAPALRQAVTQSGLFFEAHQAQWLNGDMPTTQLLAEPQAQEGLRQLAQNMTPERLAQLPPSVREAVARMHAQDPTVSARAQGENAARAPADTPTGAAAMAMSDAADSLPSLARDTLAMPERLVPIVHQQLESMATHHIAWQGQVWPGQTMQWDLYEPPDGGAGSAYEDEAREWRSTLRLTLPGLGGVEARIVWTPAGVAIRLDASEAGTAHAMRQNETVLADALEAAGVPLTAMAVAHHVVG